MLHANREFLRELACGEGGNSQPEKMIGRFIEIDGAFVIDKFRRSASKAAREYSQDLTAFECFVNSVHLEDHYEGPIDWLRAIRIGIANLEGWANERRLNCIIIKGNVGFVMKFHVIREGEYLYGHGMDTSSQGVLTIETPLWE